jgi:hypothetical protein
MWYSSVATRKTCQALPNLISSVENPQKYKDISESLVAFLSEYSYAVNQLRMPVPLPIGSNTFIEYDKQNQTIYIKEKD